MGTKLHLLITALLEHYKFLESIKQMILKLS